VDINSNSRARKLANKLFDALQGTRDYLTMRDFIPYFNTQKDAQKAFALFDKDGNGDVTKKEMRDRIIATYKERRALNASLRDMSQIVGKLDKILVVISVVLIAIFCSMVFGQSPAASLVSFGTLFVAWSFIFGGTLKNMFECLIFLFITHPYDAGDQVVVNGVTMTVAKVRVLSTVFTRGDGQYVCAPNITLLGLFINNLRRSPPQNETVVMNFDFYTPEAKLYQLKDRLNQLLDQYPRIFVPGVGFSLDNILDANKLVVNLSLNYKSNWQNGGPRAEGRNKFMMCLRNAMIELNIK
ncbi:Mechanosensitive ion channel-domain-containing protein, partial [Dimargaris cristalligena]